MNVAIRVTVRPNEPDPDGWVICKSRDALREVDRIVPGGSQYVPIGEPTIIVSSDQRTAIEWHWLTPEQSALHDALTDAERSLDDRDFWHVVKDFHTNEGVG